jgi:hypothetical protein
MSAPAQNGAVTVLRSRTQLLGEERRRIKATFPGWRAWRNPSTDIWTAYRDDEPPRFGPPAADGWQHQVSACDEATLTMLLDQQVRIDIGREFPDWRVRRSRFGDWFAFSSSSGHGAKSPIIRAVHAPILWGLLASLRTLARWDRLTP